MFILLYENVIEYESKPFTPCTGKANCTVMRVIRAIRLACWAYTFHAQIYKP